MLNEPVVSETESPLVMMYTPFLHIAGFDLLRILLRIFVFIHKRYWSIVFFVMSLQSLSLKTCSNNLYVNHSYKFLCI